MAGLSITGQMKVGTLQEGFHREFGLSLRIYDGRSFADPNSTLAQVRKKKGSGKALSVAKNMKVGNLEDKFEEEFGLKVQVAGSDDSYLCNNDLTLNGAKHEDERKLNRKSANDSGGVIDSDNDDVAASYDVDALTSSFQDDLQFDIEEWLHEEGAALAIDSYTGIYLGAEYKNDRVIICLTMTYDRLEMKIHSITKKCFNLDSVRNKIFDNYLGYASADNKISLLNCFWTNSRKTFRKCERYCKQRDFRLVMVRSSVVLAFDNR